jgi:hypothetical protein
MVIINDKISYPRKNMYSPYNCQRQSTERPGSTPHKDNHFSLRHSLQIGSGANLVSHPMGAGGSSPRGR